MMASQKSNKKNDYGEISAPDHRLYEELLLFSFGFIFLSFKTEYNI